MRLIDADALMDAFRRYMAEKFDREKCVSEENCKTCESGCLWRKIVNNAPTVYDEPVNHGRWINEVELRPELYGWVPLNSVVCSICNKSNSRETDYCPNCGAKMDKEDSDG